MHRVTRFAVQRGIRQFLDIGTGIPTSPNVHEIAQGIAPESRVVYTDNDPIVLAHARALMVSTAEGRTSYVQSDLRTPEQLLASEELRATLDLQRPVGLMLVAVVHFIEDDEEALGVVRRIVDVLPAGSYVAATVATDDFAPERLARVRETYHAHGETLRWRNEAQTEQFFEGLELVEPGIVQMHKWRPDDDSYDSVPEEDIAMYGGIGRKP